MRQAVAFVEVHAFDCSDMRRDLCIGGLVLGLGLRVA